MLILIGPERLWPSHQVQLEQSLVSEGQTLQMCQKSYVHFHFYFYSDNKTSLTSSKLSNLFLSHTNLSQYLIWNSQLIKHFNWGI